MFYNVGMTIRRGTVRIPAPLKPAPGTTLAGGR